MKTIFSNYLLLITVILYGSTVYSIQPALQISEQELELEENLLRIAQQKIEDPYLQYVQAFIWLKQLKGNVSEQVDIEQLPLVTNREQRHAWNILFPPLYMAQLGFFNTNETIYQIDTRKFLQFFWPGRLILLAWYPVDSHELKFSGILTDEDLLVAAANYGYLAQELQLQGGQCPSKKLYKILQTLLQRGLTHIHQQDARSLLHLLLQDDPKTYQNFLENEEKVLQQTQERFSEFRDSEPLYLLSTLLALTRPLNSLRDFFESWGCCPV